MPTETLSLSLPAGKKIFFVSDFHLGSPDYETSREREKNILAWIDRHEHEMGALFLLGDIFDYWFEYKYVVPKGFVRLLGRLAGLTDRGIPVHFFCGNHDAWTRSYFRQEIGMSVHRGNARLHVDDACFFIGHGDGLGPNDFGYKIMKAVFDARISRILYAALHPYWASMLASCMSRHSRKTEIRHNREQHEARECAKNRNLLGFIREELKKEPVDFFVFAHRHWPLLAEILSGTEIGTGLEASAVRIEKDHRAVLDRSNPVGKRKSYYMNTGDWIRYCSFGWYDGKTLKLEGESLKNIF